MGRDVTVLMYTHRVSTNKHTCMWDSTNPSSKHKSSGQNSKIRMKLLSTHLVTRKDVWVKGKLLKHCDYFLFIWLGSPSAVRILCRRVRQATAEEEKKTQWNWEIHACMVGTYPQKDKKLPESESKLLWTASVHVNDNVSMFLQCADCISTSVSTLHAYIRQNKLWHTTNQHHRTIVWSPLLNMT